MKKLKTLDQNIIETYIPRVKSIMALAENIGWGYSDQLEESWQEYIKK